ncbi:DUF4160 domain-containing protein [Anaeromicropila herbilytica]|uniref:DUF4160 domain-containing protein n=1 Tax=Anaeromicropila herbilytica TaxID=2785025 RepID=A0A7R7EN84_9FIRM|nr:DUF4160 domain-containing protein [Anaeromicropila herbilytica]BCN31902.1 hypothetical protein bsdtb5_31970 [Anaeromicropila herbilytica]
MPQIFKVGGYVVYFWANEGQPLEPIHVHVVEGVPAPNTTKVWITRNGKCLLANNNSKIPERTLNDVCDVIEARSKDILNKWMNFFGEISFYC